jgi:hypothetical protein
VAPNPASDETFVQFFNPVQGDVQFELYSLQGQLMASASSHFDSGSQQFELNLQGLMKGFYLFNIRHQNGWRQTVKVVVK